MTNKLTHFGPKLELDNDLLAKIIKGIESTTREDEPLITKYDTIAGDGDCGETLLNGVQGRNQGTRSMVTRGHSTNPR